MEKTSHSHTKVTIDASSSIKSSTLTNILENGDGVRLDLSGQLSNLSPQETQNILEYIFTLPSLENTKPQ